jgi:hypothetical protein
MRLLVLQLMTFNVIILQLILIVLIFIVSTKLIKMLVVVAYDTNNEVYSLCFFCYERRDKQT